MLTALRYSTVIIAYCWDDYLISIEELSGSQPFNYYSYVYALLLQHKVSGPDEFHANSSTSLDSEAPLQPTNVTNFTRGYPSIGSH